MKNPIFNGNHAKPVNKQAVLFFSAQKIEFTSTKKISQLHWGIKPKTIAIQQGEQDLTGATFGRFCVVGKYAVGSKKKEALWVVRCSCGDFETRRSRAVNNPSNDKDCCVHCRHLERLKNKPRI